MYSFASTLDQLRHAQPFSEFNIDGGYEIVPVVHPSWKSSKRRILFVIESMDSVDIKRGRLFTPSRDNRGHEQNAMIATVRNTLEQSWAMYAEYTGVNTLRESAPEPDWSLAFCNFNAARYFSLEGQDRLRVILQCAQRIHAIIEKLKPTDIVVFGDTAARYTLSGHPYADFMYLMRGVPVEMTVAGVPVVATHTLDLEPLYSSRAAGSEDDEDEDDDDNSSPGDLLYYVCRNLVSAYGRKHPHDLSHVKPKCRLVDTIEKFDALLAKLYAHPADEPIGFDIESKNLEAYSNVVYTHQYCFGGDIGYLLPLWHKDTPFSEDELKYVKAKLRRFWGTRRRSERKLFVGVNLQFDLKVTRAQFGIDTIYHTAWDIPAGEQLLDENLALFDRIRWRYGTASIKTPMGGLQAIACSYGNTLYPDAARVEGGVSKETRTNIGHLNICTNKHAQTYCVADVVIPVQIYLQQHERARRIRISSNRTYDTWYHTHVSRQMSNTVHALSHMHQAGSHIDDAYLDFLLSSDSPLIKVQREMTADLRAMPSVKKLSEELLKEQGATSGGLFGATASALNLFQINKPAHKARLFFETLGLKSVAQTPTGAPSIGKPFFAAYRLLYREVDLMEQWQKATKLLTTYVVGWRERLKESRDSMADKCLRPNFGFFSVVTGRLNSWGPSLQQIPQHGKNAKMVKRAFIATRRALGVKWDFSAAEVRKAACVSFDANLAEAFRVGQQLRRQFIQTPTPELAKELKTKGDIHIANVKRFFGMWVDKKHPLRQAIKAVVFGVIYGKAVRTLARDLENEAEARHKTIIIELEVKLRDAKPEDKESAKKALRGAEDARNEEMGKDWVEFAQDVLDKMFSDFTSLAQYLDRVQEQAAKRGWVISPIGRRRVLFRVFTGKPAAISAAGRRAKNAPIQGIASEVGITAGILVVRNEDRYICEFGLRNKVDFPQYQRAVHDANYYLEDHTMVIPSVHIKQHVATTGVTEWYKNVFGFTMVIEPEIALELSASDDESYEWDWNVATLPGIIKQALEDKVKLGIMPASDLDQAFAACMEPWVNAEKRAWLQENYPLLGVKDLDKQICAAVRAAGFEPEPLH